MSASDSCPKYVYEFRVRSLDRARPVSMVVDEISGLAPRMTTELQDFGPGLQITVKREEAIPIDPLTVIVLLEVANVTLKPMVEGFFHKLGEKMADYFSDEIDNAQISVEKEPSKMREKQKPDEHS